MLEMPKDVLDDLKRIAQAQHSLILLNEYEGVPISHETSLRSIEASTATFNVHKYQAVCLLAVGETVIQSKVLSLAIKARVVTVDVAAGTAALTDFSPTAYTVGRRQAIRLKPNPPVIVAMLPENRIVNGWLENLSLTGMGLHLPSAQITLELQTVFQRGTALRIQVQLPTEAALLEVGGVVAHSAPQPDGYFLGVNLVAEADAQHLIEAYIARRQAAVAQELETAYRYLSAQQLEERRKA